MKKLYIIIVFSLFFCFCQPFKVLAATAWPAGTGSDISAELAVYGVDNEPSGLLWHSGRSSLFVVLDNGYLVELNADGHIINSWYYGAFLDLEGVTISESDSDKLYLAEENPEQKVYEFSISSWALTGKTWVLSGMSVDPNNGLEALTYIDGKFYAGSQLNGIIYIYTVDLSTSATLNYSSTIETGTADISDLNYQSNQNIFYAIYDNANLLREYSVDGTLINEYSLPAGTDYQEGLALIPNYPDSSTQLFIGEDDAGLKVFSNFPIDQARYDNDHDGYNYTIDCNDNDDTANTFQTYYVDSDFDNYGSTTSASLCSSSPPSGYSINNTDCNDDDIMIHDLIIYYADNDSDGLGDPNNFISVCSNTAPEGYVTNANDTEPDPILEPSPEELSIYLKKKYLYINDIKIKIFQKKPKKSKLKYQDFYNDQKTEIIILALINSKKAKIITVSYADPNNCTIAKKKKLIFSLPKKKIKLKIISNKNRFKTTIGKKYYIWKIKSNGKFNKIK